MYLSKNFIFFISRFKNKFLQRHCIITVLSINIKLPIASFITIVTVYFKSQYYF